MAQKLNRAISNMINFHIDNKLYFRFGFSNYAIMSSKRLEFVSLENMIKNHLYEEIRDIWRDV